MYYLKRVITCSEDRECEAVGAVDDLRDSGATLWITDSAAKARELSDEGKAVLIWLHEGNRDQDFGEFRYACDNPGELDMDYLEGVYRRFQGIPWDILETEHCLIRETTVEDVEAFYRIYEEPSITEFMDSLYDDPQEERAYARDYIDKVYSFYGFGIWTVLEKPEANSDLEPEVIGRAGICYKEGYDDPEVGFVIAADRQGRGYATEICDAILKYGHERLGFQRILAFVQPANKASMRVCDKLGMNRVGQASLQGTAYEIRCHEVSNECQYMPME